MKKLMMMIVMLCLGITAAYAGDLSLNHLISDNMVLQSGVKNNIWGKAKPGQKVTVEFVGTTATATAGKNGDWMVKLPAMKVTKTPQTMKVTAGADKLEVKNILVGEVWVCSGQSNMESTMNFLKSQYGKPTPIADEFPKANYPLIRQFKVQKAHSHDKLLKTVQGDWKVCNPKNIGGFSAVAYFFARKLYKDLGVPVGILNSSYGGTPIESWTRREVIAATPDGAKKIKDWEEKDKKYDLAAEQKKFKPIFDKWLKDLRKAQKEKKPIPHLSMQQPVQPSNHPFYPSTLYNAMISPILPYRIKGVIWYQGESNVGYFSTYEKMFTDMITDWRKQWGEGDFPFYFVQLAGFMNTEKNFPLNAFCLLRDTQFKTLKLPNTGMAVASDVGDSKDIHPRNKIDVGERLALWALAKDYGRKIVYSGPLYKSSTFKDGKAIIKFSNVGSGLIVASKKDVWSPTVPSKKPLATFQICGSDMKWVWADAKIVGKDTVEVSSPKIKAPVAVRYSWQTNPVDANLCNKELLPASQFRTDNFPM